MFRHFSVKLLLFILHCPADRDLIPRWTLIKSGPTADNTGENDSIIGAPARTIGVYYERRHSNLFKIVTSNIHIYMYNLFKV